MRSEARRANIHLFKGIIATSEQWQYVILRTLLTACTEEDTPVADFDHAFSLARPTLRNTSGACRAAMASYLAPALTPGSRCCPCLLSTTTAISIRPTRDQHSEPRNMTHILQVHLSGTSSISRSLALILHQSPAHFVAASSLPTHHSHKSQRRSC